MSAIVLPYGPRCEKCASPTDVRQFNDVWLCEDHWPAHTTARVGALPDCDLCRVEFKAATVATFDGKTKAGPWAFMCVYHFGREGVGLGLGMGQKLFVN